MVFWLFFWVLLASLFSGVAVVIFMRTSLVGAYVSLFGSDIVKSWQKIISVIIVVSSLAGGTSLYNLERYLLPASESRNVLELNSDLIALEAVRALLDGASSVISVLLVMLVISVLVVLIMKIKGVLPQSDNSK